MKRILLVEDDLLFAQLIKLNLKNYQVNIAKDALEAIELINSQDFDLIILDLLLPGYNGVGLINEMVGSDISNKIPIMICSSVADKLNINQLSGANVKAILDKTTVKPARIKQTVDQIIYG